MGGGQISVQVLAAINGHGLDGQGQGRKLAGEEKVKGAESSLLVA